MPGLHDLNEVILLHVLDLSLDASVLELAAASHSLRNAVDNCRGISSEGPWQHMPGVWAASGLWRYLGLGDLKVIPDVTLRCETKFLEMTEVLAFFKAIKTFAAETIDGHVTFNKLTFPGAAAIFSREHPGVFCPSNRTTVIFEGNQIECVVDVLFDPPDEGGPRITLCAMHLDDMGLLLRREDAQMRPLMCCSSLLLPELKLFSGFDIYEDHHLDADSPLTDLVRANLPVPIMFGVTGFDIDG